MNDIYWLDNFFNYATSSYQNDANKSLSLEAKMNSITKLIVLSFFFMKIFLPLKVASGVMMGMLFITSAMYYYLNERYFYLKENFEEKPYEKVGRQKTKLNMNEEDVIHAYKREVYIPPRSPKRNIEFKTILPVESYHVSPPPPPKQHPETLKPIEPKESIYSQYFSQIDENKTPQSFLSIAQNNQVQQKPLKEMEVFQRTNIDHLNLDFKTLTPEDYFQHVDQVYFEEQMKLRQKYTDHLNEINQERDQQLKIAPIHTNFRGRGGGGPSFSKHYAGPRGTRR